MFIAKTQVALYPAGRLKGVPRPGPRSDALYLLVCVVAVLVFDRYIRAAIAVACIGFKIKPGAASIEGVPVTRQ